MKNNKKRIMFNLFEEKGKYESLNKVSLIISILMLIIDIILCIINLPYIRFIFNTTILFSFIAIFTYLVSDYKLERIQKQIIYLEDEKILNEKYIKMCLNEKDIDKVRKEKRKYNTFTDFDLRLVNNIPLDILIRLKETLESDKNCF